jgi:hypothetical protein
MVRFYVSYDKSEKSIIPSQGPFCLQTRGWGYRKNNKVMYTGISFDLGKF